MAASERLKARIAAAYIAQLGAAHVFPAPIVTKLEIGGFFPAEDYHQHFFDRNPTHPYIVHWDKPKVAAVNGDPTAGCVALAREDLLQILSAVAADTKIEIS